MSMNTTEMLLINNVLNEVLHGLPASGRIRTLLQHQKDLEGLAGRLKVSSAEAWTPQERRLLSECINAVIQILGPIEFETRVGVGTNEANVFAQRLVVPKG